MFLCVCYLVLTLKGFTQAVVKDHINTKKNPNFVLIMADDCTLWDLGPYGSKNAITPNINKLATEGMKMERCYQAAPMCSPTRHNLLTGIYPVKSGAYPNHTFADPSTKSMAHYLKELGYRVGFSGKRHINPPEVFPFEYLGNDNNPDFDLIEDFLREEQKTDTPFALVLMSNEPHTPWNKGDSSLFNPDKLILPPWFIDTPETRKAYCNYLAEINYLDGQVGTAMDLLKKYNFDDNTMVIFLSEQGAQFPFAKWTLYEAGVKSAMIAKLPGIIEPSSVSSSIVEYADVLPTIIQLAGGEIPIELDGKSMVPIFQNPEHSLKEYSFSMQTTRGIHAGSDHYAIRAVVSDRFRYIWNLTPEAEFKNAINNGNKNGTGWYYSWEQKAKNDQAAKALIHRYSFRPEEELYDIVKDPYCLKNLAKNPDYNDIKNELHLKVVEWMKECGDKGQVTEMQALDHKWANYNKSKN